jgi:hypothetical protein
VRGRRGHGQSIGACHDLGVQSQLREPVGQPEQNDRLADGHGHQPNADPHDQVAVSHPDHDVAVPDADDQQPDADTHHHVADANPDDDVADANDQRQQRGGGTVRRRFRPSPLSLAFSAGEVP